MQGIGTGNPGYFAMTEKNFALDFGSVNVYTGIAFRSNESHNHAIGGFSLRPDGPWAIGLQLDGHNGNPYLTHRSGPIVHGIYLAGYEKVGYLVGARF